jgi:hypothetical protein
MSTSTPAPATSPTRRVTFAAYDVGQIQPHKKPSATAFAIIRRALIQSGGKPTNVELPGAWRIAAELQMIFSDMEYRHEEVAGIIPDQLSSTGFREARMPVIVLNPKGASFITTEQHVQQLRTIFDEWVKSKGTHAEAVSIHLAYQWFADPASIVDASKESAIASGAVAPVGQTVASDKPSDPADAVPTPRAASTPA